jgi:hypothetical protein
MTRQPRCSDCDAEMEAGFVIDLGDMDIHTVAQWHPGEPTQSKFLGLSMGLKTDRKRMLTVHAFRCPKCSALRLFAPPAEQTA